MALPVIAIIGRPNVGKSTLFNRLIGKRYAITSPVAGTTRDRIYHPVEIGAYDAILIDTGGMEFEKKKDIEADVQSQAKVAIDEANIIYFIIDASAPLTASDLDCAQFLRKFKKEIIVIAHKADNKSASDLSAIYSLGLGEPVSVSSIHNFGIPDLEKETVKRFKKMKWKKEKIKKENKINIAIVGKPNVGKSSLVNALLGENRLIVSDKPGTTIDATDTPIKHLNNDFVLIDTAGLRRRGKRGVGIEKYGVIRALQAVSRSDVTCLVLDWSTGIANQDLHVSEYILDAGKGLIVVVNKSDLMEDPAEDQKKFLGILQYRMSYAPWAPVIFTSTVSRKNIFRIFENALHIKTERHKIISDSEFKIFVKTVTLSHPPSRAAKKIIISKGAQTGVCPPTFTFICNNPDILHFSYRRFLENEIRRKYGFHGTSIKLLFKRG